MLCLLSIAVKLRYITFIRTISESSALTVQSRTVSQKNKDSTYYENKQDQLVLYYNKMLKLYTKQVGSIAASYTYLPLTLAQRVKDVILLLSLILSPKLLALPVSLMLPLVLLMLPLVLLMLSPM